MVQAAVWEDIYVDDECVALVGLPPGRPLPGQAESFSTRARILASSRLSDSPYTTHIFVHRDLRYAVKLPRATDVEQIVDAFGTRQCANEPSPFDGDIAVTSSRSVAEMNAIAASIARAGAATSPAQGGSSMQAQGADTSEHEGQDYDKEGSSSSSAPSSA